MNSEDVQTLTAEQLALLSNRLRQRVLELLCQEDLTAGQLRQRLEDPPSNLYYHLQKLEGCGLIEVVATERRRGAVEKTYGAVAAGFTVPGEFLAVGAGGHLREVLGTVRILHEECLRKLGESFRRGFSGSARDGEGGDPDSADLAVPMINNLTVRATPEKTRQIRSRLEELIREMLRERPPEGEDVVESTFQQLFFVSGPASASSSGEDGSAGDDGA